MKKSKKESDIFRKTRDFILKNNLVSCNDRILLSLSAGKDSMAMLHLFSRLSGECNLDIGIFHLNHLTRERESDLDEEFIAGIAAGLGFRFFGEQYDFKKHNDKGKSFQEHAREIRYALLTNYAGTYGYSKTATAHNYDDNVETVLMRIFTGTGMNGLMGIPVSSNGIIRPILCLAAHEIIYYLEENNLKWREDLSNTDNKYQRNYTRNIIIPAIKKQFPSFHKNIANVSIHAMESSVVFERMFNAYYCSSVTESVNEVLIDFEKIRDDEIMLKYILSRVLKKKFRSLISHAVHEEIIKNFLNGKSNSILYKNSYVIIEKIYRGRGIIRLRPNQEIERSGQWEYEFSPEYSLTKNILIKELGIILDVTVYDSDFFEKNQINENIHVSFDRGETIVIRNRRAGDRIKLEFGTKKIKDLLIEKKLDNVDKNKVPLLVIGSEIAAFMPGLLGIQGNRVSINHKVSGNTKKIVVMSKSN